MPFPFSLATTSELFFPAFASSNTHPSLPLTAATHRNVLRSVLKKHKRLPAQSQTANLSTINSTLLDYLPYLFALKAGLSGRAIHDEEVEVALRKEIEVEWRTTLASANVPGRDAPRVKGRGIDYEATFALTTLANAYSLQARSSLYLLYGSVTPTIEQRMSIITTATKHLIEANSIHNYLSSLSLETDASSAVIETLSQTQSGLAALAMAEATLLAVLKDDPYPAIVVQDRNKDDKDWMIRAPEIPKVRVHLFARLCLGAAEHAGKAEAMLSASGRANDALIGYVSDLQRTSRARACRFFGIDAELGGETGTGIAWLTGGKRQLGFAGKEEKGGKMQGLAKFKKDWSERREDKRVEKGSRWGSDGGRLEELRVIEMLEQKWNKENDTINTQLIPPSDPLVANMPLGRDIHSMRVFVPPTLDEESLARMRAPPEREAEDGAIGDDDSSDEERGGKTSTPGAFPGETGNAFNDSPYY